MRRFFGSTVREEEDTALPFIFEINTANTSTGSSTDTQFKLPLLSAGTYDFDVDWGDSTSDTITVWDAGTTNHTYTSTGTYVITITGEIRGWAFQSSGDRLKILDISAWGPLQFLDVTNLSLGAFGNCVNLQVSAIDFPDFSGTTEQVGFFSGCTALTGNSSFIDWNVSGLTNISSFFINCSNFNAPLNNWDVSSVTNFRSLFQTCFVFNQPLNNWDTSNALSFFNLFFSARAFNQDIENWNVSNVTNFSWCFHDARLFNQPLNGWNVSSATTMLRMFSIATVFNQPLNTWNTSNVKSMQRMFNGPMAFNQNIGGWNVSNVTDFSSMFINQENFNQDISSWVISSAINTSSMFNGATNFNQNIGGWNVGNVTNMSFMFNRATNFNQNIGGWNVAKVANFENFMSFKTDANYSSSNLDAIYNGWSLLTFVNTDLNINFNTIKYTAAGQAGRDILTGAPNNWDITDGGI